MTAVHHVDLDCDAGVDDALALPRARATEAELRGPHQIVDAARQHPGELQLLAVSAPAAPDLPAQILALDRAGGVLA